MNNYNNNQNNYLKEKRANMDIELLKHAKGYIEKMANGINPLTGATIPEDELLNNIRISRCLFYVNNILNEVITTNNINHNKRKKLPFSITEEQLSHFNYSNTPLYISQIASLINELTKNQDMVKLRPVSLSKWLISLEILMETVIDGKKCKIPTEFGKTLDIYTEKRIGYSGEYYVVLYPLKAQEFIINNFDNYIEFINK